MLSCNALLKDLEVHGSSPEYMSLLHMSIRSHASPADQTFILTCEVHELQQCAANNPTLTLTSNYSQWMMVPQSLVTLDGTACNMVGTGYTAFLNQPVSPSFCSHGQAAALACPDHGIAPISLACPQ